MDISLPAYQQVTREIRREIITGKLEPSQKLESIKDLASRFAVNHNTVQRALSQLEEEGLLRSRRTAGKFVTDNQLLIGSIRKKEARRVTEEFLDSLGSIGISPGELQEMLREPELPFCGKGEIDLDK